MAKASRQFAGLLVRQISPKQIFFLSEIEVRASRYLAGPGQPQDEQGGSHLNHNKNEQLSTFGTRLTIAKSTSDSALTRPNKVSK